MRTALVDRAIDVASLIAEVSDDSCGAVSVFLGCVRDVNDGRPVTGIEYSSYRAMAEREMTAIVREAAQAFDIRRVVVEHRVGALGLRDVSVAVVVAHPHRAPALDATRYVIEQLKQRVPIWKLEHYTDGSREWVGAGTREPGTANGELESETRRVAASGADNGLTSAASPLA